MEFEFKHDLSLIQVKLKLIIWKLIVYFPTGKLYTHNIEHLQAATINLKLSLDLNKLELSIAFAKLRKLAIWLDLWALRLWVKCPRLMI